MSIETYITKHLKKCIEKYLDTFGVIIKKSKKELLLCDQHKLFGKLVYDFNGTELMIETVNIDVNKRGIPIKLFKVFLLYLISLYIDKGATLVTLIADSSYGYDEKMSKGRELRLACYYQELGFKPIKNRELDMYINICKRKLTENHKSSYYENMLSTCLLYECQKQILLGNFNINARFEILKVSMSRMIPKLLNLLKDTIKNMNC